MEYSIPVKLSSVFKRFAPSFGVVVCDFFLLLPIVFCFFLGMMVRCFVVAAAALFLVLVAIELKSTIELSATSKE